MEVIKFNFLQWKTRFKYNLYLNCMKIFKCPKAQSIATGISVKIEKHFWSALEIIMVLLGINYLRLLVPKLNVLPNAGVCFNSSYYYVTMDIYDIFKLILSILFLHFYIKQFMYKSEWIRYKWLENFIIIGSYVGVFTIVLTLSFIGLVIVPNTIFEKLQFIILLHVSYFTYYTTCRTDWFDKHEYSVRNTYTSTVKHNVLKGRRYLIISNLATRWHTKKVKKITQKEKKVKKITQKEKTIIQSAPQDPRLNRSGLANKDINKIHNQFTSLNTSQSLDEKDEYLISTRIVRPDSYYDQLDTSAWGKSALNEYPNKLCQYKLIPM